MEIILLNKTCKNHVFATPLTFLKSNGKTHCFLFVGSGEASQSNSSCFWIMTFSYLAPKMHLKLYHISILPLQIGKKISSEKIEMYNILHDKSFWFHEPHPLSALNSQHVLSLFILNVKAVAATTFHCDLQHTLAFQLLCKQRHVSRLVRWLSGRATNEHTPGKSPPLLSVWRLMVVCRITANSFEAYLLDLILILQLYKSQAMSYWLESYSFSVISVENRYGPDKARSLCKCLRHQNPVSVMRQEGGPGMLHNHSTLQQTTACCVCVEEADLTLNCSVYSLSFIVYICKDLLMSFCKLHLINWDLFCWGLRW